MARRNKPSWKARRDEASPVTPHTPDSGLADPRLPKQRRTMRATRHLHEGGFARLPPQPKSRRQCLSPAERPRMEERQSRTARSRGRTMGQPQEANRSIDRRPCRNRRSDTTERSAPRSAEHLPEVRCLSAKTDARIVMCRLASPTPSALRVSHPLSDLSLTHPRGFVSRRIRS
jgi:hypothetical protein